MTRQDRRARAPSDWASLHHDITHKFIGRPPQADRLVALDPQREAAR